MLLVVGIWGAGLTGVGGDATSALAQDDPVDLDDVFSRKAHRVLVQHCARCHQMTADETALPADAQRQKSTASSDQSWASPPAFLGAIADLKWLSRQPDLVQPGRPEASRLYQVLVSRHMPHDVLGALKPGREPSLHDIRAIREWIEALPSAAGPDVAATCGTDRSGGGLNRGARREALKAFRDGLADNERDRLAGFVLDDAGGACLQSVDQQGPRRGERTALTARLMDAAVVAEGATTGLSLRAVDGVSDVTALFLHDAKTSEALQALSKRQDAIALARLELAGLASGPYGAVSVLSLAWLASTALVSEDWKIASNDRRRLVWLARQHRRLFSIDEAAIDLGLSRQRLLERLDKVSGALMPTAEALKRGPIARTRWLRLAAHLEGINLSTIPGHDERPILPDGLSLWTDKTAYDVNEAVSVSVHSDRDCRLTLISIEPDGRATVLFPNRFEPDNRLPAGETRQVPAESSPYDLTLDRPGRERFLAVCLLEDRGEPPGIVHDFDLLYFTPLGDWDSYVARSLEADRIERSLVGRRVSKRKRRRLRAKGILKRYAKTPLKQMRAAIAVTVEPDNDSQD